MADESSVYSAPLHSIRTKIGCAVGKNFCLLPVGAIGSSDTVGSNVAELLIGFGQVFLAQWAVGRTAGRARTRL